MSSDPDPPNSRVRVSSTSEMETDSSSVWDWGNLFDFSLDGEADPLILPWDLPSPTSPAPPPPPPPPQPQQEEESTAAAAAAGSSSSKIRKRDPRLVCENFLAGRVPCACPEVDEMMLREEEEAEAAAGGRKRVKVRAKDGAAVVVRCQVPGCEVDIRELKGYHRRHRVCLRCASATSVVILGEDRRYCQQCGK